MNPKSWFYGFGRHLNRRSEHVRRALAGSAAEQWLNMELNAFLLGVLPKGLYTYPESSKRDVTVFQFTDPTHHERQHTEAAVIETKVVYKGYPPTRVASQVSVLARQLNTVKTECAEGCKAVGLVLGVWTDWHNEDRPYRARTVRKQSLSGFRRVMGAAVREGALKEGYRSMKPTLETLVPPSRVAVGPWKVEVALVGQYFIRQSTPRD